MHLEQFLHLGAESIVKSKDVSGCTPLFLACLQGQSGHIVKLLLDNGADVLIRGTRNMSPLDTAMLIANFNVLEEVFKYVSTLPEQSIRTLYSRTSDDGSTVLHYCLSCPDITTSTAYFRRLMALIPNNIANSLVTQPDLKGCTRL